jgi:nucleoside recognition membrane protein YjiH
VRESSNANPAAITRLFLASALGIVALLLPVPYEGSLHILLGLVTGYLQDKGAAILPAVVTLTCLISALASLVYSATDRRRDPDHAAEILLRPGPIWLVMRVLGTVTAVLVFYQLGSEWIWHADIGGLVLNDLMAAAFIPIGLACIVLPFLTEFGLMELVAGFVERGFRRLFTVPGRSAVDAVASWLGGSSVGVLVTVGQYKRGLYSAREASVIATNFSIVSIAFAYVIVETVKLEALFFPFYAVVTMSGIACAVILPRIPPLRGKPDSVVVQNSIRAEDGVGGGMSVAWRKALARAEHSPGPRKLIRDIGVNILDIWLGLIPAAMFIATVSLAVAEMTPLFDWLSWPFGMLLEAFQVEAAQEAAPAMVVGFADMFLPALLAADIASEPTRFTLAVIAVGQLIFMSEVGVLILQSALPLGFLDLIGLFILRTLIILPLAVIATSLIF